jgi:hypothetical protein
MRIRAPTNVSPQLKIILVEE